MVSTRSASFCKVMATTGTGFSSRTRLVCRWLCGVACVTDLASEQDALEDGVGGAAGQLLVHDGPRQRRERAARLQHQPAVRPELRDDRRQDCGRRHRQRQQTKMAGAPMQSPMLSTLPAMVLIRLTASGVLGSQQAGHNTSGAKHMSRLLDTGRLIMVRVLEWKRVGESTNTSYTQWVWDVAPGSAAARCAIAAGMRSTVSAGSGGASTRAAESDIAGAAAAVVRLGARGGLAGSTSSTAPS